jgi:hypothetical protein
VLALIALDDPTVQKTLGLDGRIAMSTQYPTTMLWSRATRWRTGVEPVLDRRPELDWA